MFSKLALLFTSSLLATSLAAPVDSASTSLETRGFEWDNSGLNPVCLYDGDSVDWHYIIVIPEDGTQDTSGHDAAGNCGGGFLDNLHGQSLTITKWGCSYGFAGAAANSATTNFRTTVATTEQVHDAYNAATGGLNLICQRVSGSDLAQVEVQGAA